MAPESLPEAANARLAGATFSSKLSSADYAATLAAGLEPLGIVQGLCVVRWSWYGPKSPYGGNLPIGSGTKRLKKRHFDPQGRGGNTWGGKGFRTRRAVPSIVYQSHNFSDWTCQHSPMNPEHEPGVNFEQIWVEELWSEGFAQARARMVTEAEVLGAHGVVGVIDQITDPVKGVKEFLLRGTAVRVRDIAPPREIWSTYLAGERLIKLVEAGWAPVSVVVALSSLRIWPACSTESQLHGSWGDVSKIRQIENGHYIARSLARERVHAEAGPDDVHGVRYEVAEHEIADADEEITCTVWGSRIRRFAPSEQFATATATVSLA